MTNWSPTGSRSQVGSTPKNSAAWPRVVKANSGAWHRDTRWIIALLVLFFPLGLILMWLNTRWTRRTKKIVTGVVAVCALIGAISSATSSPSGSTTAKTARANHQAPTPLTVSIQNGAVGVKTTEGTGNVTATLAPTTTTVVDLGAKWRQGHGGDANTVQVAVQAVQTGIGILSSSSDVDEADAASLSGLAKQSQQQLSGVAGDLVNDQKKTRKCVSVYLAVRPNRVFPCVLDRLLDDLHCLIGGDGVSWRQCFIARLGDDSDVVFFRVG